MIIEHASDGLAGWLHEKRAALLVGLKDNAVIVISSDNGDALTTLVRRFEGFRRFSIGGNLMAVATETAITILSRSGPNGGHDCVYAPRSTYHAGRADIHDIEVHADGSATFVASEFDAVARTNPIRSFDVVWRPPFLPRKVTTGDNCHLNGMVLANGDVECVSMFAKKTYLEGWREEIVGGGLVMAASGDVLASGLTLPHCPRRHGDRLWLCNSGAGTIGVVDRGSYERLAFCGGLTRGLVFHAGAAIVGVSAPRHAALFAGLPLEAELRASGKPPRAGVDILDAASGDVLHRLRLAEAYTEVYDVGILANTLRPAIASAEQSERLFAVRR